MTPKQKDLARRFVACKHWRWMPGMRCVHRWTGGIRVLADENGEQSESYVVVPGARGNAVMAVGECGIMGSFPGAGSPYPLLPDLTDPATLGCILALVRDATGDRRIHCRVRANVYRVYSGVSPVGRWMESEAEALLLALEAA
jgi:hypothetical protein